MSDLLSRRLALLERADQHDLLRHCRHGLEKESLRVDADGRIFASEALHKRLEYLGKAPEIVVVQ